MALNLVNALVFLTSLAPIWALLIDKINLKGKKWFWLTESAFVSLAFGFLLFFQHWKWDQWAGLIWFLYSMEMGIFLLLFTKRFGYKKFSRSLALTLLLVFVLSEAHEWTGFVLCDYLNVWEDTYTATYGRVPIIQRVMSNLYVVVSFGFAFKMAGLRANKKIVLLFALSLLISPIFFNFEVLGLTHVIKRVLMFGFWACIFYFYADPSISSGIGGKNA